jgi:hypothetical protein
MSNRQYHNPGLVRFEPDVVWKSFKGCFADYDHGLFCSNPVGKQSRRLGDLFQCRRNGNEKLVP